MKRVLSLLFVILTIALSALAKSNNMPKYDITGAGSGNEGMVLVKVFVYTKSANDLLLKQRQAMLNIAGNSSLLRENARTMQASSLVLMKG